MIKGGDIFQYTSTVGGETKYYIEKVYETTGEWYVEEGVLMVIMSWEDDMGWHRVCRPLKGLMEILQSGHIKITGTDKRKPITHIRPHTFNPKLRNIPISVKKMRCPYRTPKLYEWI